MLTCFFSLKNSFLFLQKQKLGIIYILFDLVFPLILPYKCCNKKYEDLYKVLKKPKLSINLFLFIKCVSKGASKLTFFTFLIFDFLKSSLISSG